MWQFGQRGEVFHLRAAQVAAVQSVEGIARAGAGAHLEDAAHHVFLVLTLLRQEEVPVGQGYQPVARHLAADAVLLAHGVGLDEGEGLLAVGGRQEQLGRTMEVVGTDIALGRSGA